MEESPGLDEIREVAKTLEEHLEYKFEEIREAWEETKKSGTPLPSDYYFDLYKLRFFPNHRNGYHYLEKIMANRNPGFGCPRGGGGQSRGGVGPYFLVDVGARWVVVE